MRRLETSFAGLKLKNPFIVSSSGLTSTPEKNKKWEDAGASAVVLKSLFQEEIEEESLCMQHGMHSEEMDYLLQFNRGHRLNEYIRLITETKERCTIPVIASINCFQSTEWTNFARHICEAGADALELNIMDVQTEVAYEYGAYERKHIEILNRVRRYVRLPIIVKLGMNLTNPVALVSQLYANGASAVVMFNHPYRPDIQIENLSFYAGEMWTRPSDICDALRWVGISSALVPHMDYAISGGVHDGWNTVKAILSGASAVEVCTTIFWNGSQRIQVMIEQLQQWMSEHGYESISQFMGRMNQNAEEGHHLYQRTQFMKYFSGYKGKGKM